MDAEVQTKLDCLQDILQDMGRVAVAFSGGVDSTLLLQTAHDVLGPDVLAVSASSPAFPAREQEEARAFCENAGIEQLIVATHELDVPGYRDNPANRCYLCKRALFAELGEAARTRGFDILADGSNVDDAGDYRPGMAALAELGVRSPLREAGLTKADIRLVSREMGLATWDKPSCACLSSRFAYGERISEERLAQVDKAEQYLQDLGLHQVRVRVHGTMARIEVTPDETAAIAAEPLRSQVVQALKDCGFSYVALDLDGYRTGSMNKTLPDA